MNNFYHYIGIEEFAERGSGIVRFATAPDGLPLLTVVYQPQTAEQLLQSAALALGVETRVESRYAGTPLEPLVGDLDRILREHRVQRLPLPGGQATGGDDTLDVIVLPRPFRQLGGATLLERIFEKPGLSDDGTWSRPPNVTGASPDTRATQGPSATTFAPPPVTPPPTAVFAGAGANEPLPPKFIPGEARLGLSTDGRLAAIVRTERTGNGWPQYTFRRMFIEEALAAVPGSFCLGNYRRDTCTPEKIDVLNPVRYQELRSQNPDESWTWGVPRGALAPVILNVAADLARLHAAAEVHGDLKPANILLSADGVQVIDSLGLREGNRSPAMTRGWAAPEQILGGVVQFQTDQYAIGLMLLELTQGVLYGEEARISIPTGGRAVETHTVLRDPGVYIDPESAAVKSKHVDAWRDLIERCVRFEPGQRFESMEALMAALRPLVEGNSLTGEITVGMTFGRMVLGCLEGTSERQPCWLVG